jgi:hypothetical protein
VIVDVLKKKKKKKNIGVFWDVAPCALVVFWGNVLPLSSR